MTQIGRADPPLASAIHEISDLARHQVGRSEKLVGLHFEDVTEYPDFAWQESLVNAVAHRDYEMQGRETEVWFFEDRLEVSSPGELVPPVTVDALREGRRAHATRNPRLVRVLADAEIMRDEGEGIVRVFREMADRFLREPEMTSETGLFTNHAVQRTRLVHLRPRLASSRELVSRHGRSAEDAASAASRVHPG